MTEQETKTQAAATVELWERLAVAIMVDTLDSLLPGVALRDVRLDGGTAYVTVEFPDESVMPVSVTVFG